MTSCPVCGIEGCGPHGTATAPVDIANMPRREANVSPLRTYRVQLEGGETTMRLNERDAARLGGVPVDGPQQTVELPGEPVEAKSRRSSNKARRAQSNKGGA